MDLRILSGAPLELDIVNDRLLQHTLRLLDHVVEEPVPGRRLLRRRIARVGRLRAGKRRAFSALAPNAMRVASALRWS